MDKNTENATTTEEVIKHFLQEKRNYYDFVINRNEDDPAIAPSMEAINQTVDGLVKAFIYSRLDREGKKMGTISHEKISESLSRMSVRVTVDEGTSAETNKKTGTEQINNFYKGQF